MFEQISYFLHHGDEICRSALSPSRHQDLYAALVCGLDLPPNLERQIFIDTGLIHILVVSGAHLGVISSLTFFLPAPLRLFLLAVYCWLCGFNAPVVRAWWRRFVAPIVRPWGPSPLQIEVVTAAITLTLWPFWFKSQSFLMSWLCALCLTLPPIPGLNRSISQCLYCYVALFPLVPSSPITILINLLLAPAIGGFLFPLCALTVICPALTPWVDTLWDVLLKFLDQWPTSPPAPFRVTSKYLIFYPLFLHLILIQAEISWRRARAFS